MSMARENRVSIPGGDDYMHNLKNVPNDDGLTKPSSLNALKIIAP